MKQSQQYLSTLVLIALLLGLVSCSGPKGLSSSDNGKNLSDIKDNLTFKTRFGADGSMNIKATNGSDKTIDISAVSVVIEQVSTQKSKAYSLEELNIGAEIDPSDMAIFELLLAERIAEDFKGQNDKYNVILVYDSQKALKNSDEKCIYFITYKYPIK